MAVRQSLAWMDRAACKGQTDLFFTEGSGFHGTQAVQAARQVCARCPVKRECLDYALNDPSLSGTWAGTTTKQRSEIRGDRRRAAELAG